jgi:phage terminase large subunit GpA-like protein
MKAPTKKPRRLPLMTTPGRSSMVAAPWARAVKTRAAFAVGERLTVSQWAKANRVLTEKQSAEPGNWSNDRTPYLVGIMDALSDPQFTDITIMKAAQVGMSEAIRNALGYWIDQDPGPALWVMPDEDSAKEIMAEKLGPLIRETPCLAEAIGRRSTPDLARHDGDSRRVGRLAAVDGVEAQAVRGL